MTSSAAVAAAWVPLSNYTSDLQTACLAFQAMVTAPASERGRHLRILADIETQADINYVGLIQHAESSAMSWSEREALYQLLACMDSVLDELGAAGSLLTAYELDTVPPELSEQAATMVELSTSARAAVEQWQRPFSVVRGASPLASFDDGTLPPGAFLRSAPVSATPGDPTLRQHRTLMDLVDRAVRNLRRLRDSLAV